METNSTRKLISITENKGIKFSVGDKSLFKKYSYFQVINAYKNLFVLLYQFHSITVSSVVLYDTLSFLSQMIDFTI